MSLFPDGRVCQLCGGYMEVHVDRHCSVCGWKPGDPSRVGVLRKKSAKEILREMMDPKEEEVMVQGNRTVTISGPIGSGKTTIAKLIVGMLLHKGVDVTFGEMAAADRKILEDIRLAPFNVQSEGRYWPVMVAIEHSNPEENVTKKRVKDLLQRLIDRSELMGSRGSARRRSLPEPEGVDYDYCIFLDYQPQRLAIKEMMSEVVEKSGDFTWHNRPNGYATISGYNMDISVHPHVKREELLLYDDMRHRGVSKELATQTLDAMQAKRNDQIGEVTGMRGEEDAGPANPLGIGEKGKDS